MQTQALDVRFMRWVARLQVPIVSQLLILVYARVLRAKWYNYRLHEFKSLISFMLRRADLHHAHQQASLSKSVCAPIDGQVIFSGPISHDLAHPVKGAGFNMAQLLGVTMPQLTSGLVISVCQSSAQHIYAPCDMIVEKSFQIYNYIQLSTACSKSDAAQYRGEGRQIVLAKTSKGTDLVMVFVGGRIFNDIMCPALSIDTESIHFSKGESMGYFIQGAVVMMFGGDVQWSSALLGQNLDVLSDIGGIYES